MIDRIGDAISRELRRFGAVTGLAPLVEAWPGAVGPEIARNAWPARLGRDRTLHVHTSSSAWAFELSQLEARVRESLGDLAPPRLRFAVGPLPEPAAEDGLRRSPTQIEPTQEQVDRAHELAAEIENENLRKVVAKAAALSLAKAHSDR